MLKKILAVIAAIGSFLSALFYVLMKQAKDEKKIFEEEVNKKDTEIKKEREAEQKANEVRKENEKKLDKVKSSNNLDSFNECINILSDN